MLDAATISPVTQSACLTGSLFGSEDPPCFGTEEQAQAAIDALAVRKQAQEFCVTGTGLTTDPCFPSRDEAEEQIVDVGTELSQNFCIVGRGDADPPERRRRRVLPDTSRRPRDSSAISS